MHITQTRALQKHIRAYMLLHSKDAFVMYISSDDKAKIPLGMSGNFV